MGLTLKAAINQEDNALKAIRESLWRFPADSFYNGGSVRTRAGCAALLDLLYDSCSMGTSNSRSTSGQEALCFDDRFYPARKTLSAHRLWPAVSPLYVFRQQLHWTCCSSCAVHTHWSSDSCLDRKIRAYIRYRPFRLHVHAVQSELIFHPELRQR